MLIIGDSEVENREVSVRRRGEDGDLGAMNTSDFVEKVVGENDSKIIW